MKHNSFRNYVVKMSGQIYSKICQSIANLSHCYQSIQEILHFKYFVICSGMKSCRRKKWEVLLVMGPFIIVRLIFMFSGYTV